MNCPRCGRQLFQSWGEEFCYTCGTITFKAAAHDLVEEAPRQKYGPARMTETHCRVGHEMTPNNIVMSGPKRLCLACGGRKKPTREQSTHCHRGHLLSGDNLRLVGKDKKRLCRTCNNALHRKTYAANKVPTTG